MKQKTKVEATPIVQSVITENQEQTAETFVVVRDGYRVSEREYQSNLDAIALAELSFWDRVAKKHSYGEPVSIVKYNSKLHRIW